MVSRVPLGMLRVAHFPAPKMDSQGSDPVICIEALVQSSWIKLDISHL